MKIGGMFLVLAISLIVLFIIHVDKQEKNSDQAWVEEAPFRIDIQPGDHYLPNQCPVIVRGIMGREEFMVSFANTLGDALSEIAKKSPITSIEYIGGMFDGGRMEARYFVTLKPGTSCS